MRYTVRSGYGGSFSAGGHFPRGVKWLLISNIALFLIYFFAAHTGLGALFNPFKLVPAMVLKLLFVWQLFTYMFLHDPWGFMHILLNMFMLWMFGKDLEAIWGTRRFLEYYFLCGVGAGISVVVVNLLFGDLNSATIGASGAIFGLLLAFGMMFPDTTVYFSFLFPIKAKYFVMIMGAIEFLSNFATSGSGVSHVAHLGGMVFGFFYLRSRRPRRLVKTASLWERLSEGYRRWKFERNKRKFQVYLRKRDGGRDRWTQ